MTRTLLDLANPTEEELLMWVKESIKTRSNVFSHGYQGRVYLYQSEDRRLIVKVPRSRGLMRIIHNAMLRNERRVYSRLAEIDGVPTCYGLLDGCYLVLGYVDGIPLRTATIDDRKLFFEKLLQLIRRLHSANVAHGDLKKKDNVLVVRENEPCVIDFGAAVIKKPGIAPINRYLYDIAKRFDFNAWVKLKTDSKTRDLVSEGNEYYRRTRVEKMARWIKRAYVKRKKALIAKRYRSRLR